MAWKSSPMYAEIWHAADGFQVLSISPQVHLAMHQQLLAFVHQSHDVIRILNIKTKLFANLRSLAGRISRPHFVELRIRIRFEFCPDAFVYK